LLAYLPAGVWTQEQGTAKTVSIKYTCVYMIQKPAAAASTMAPAVSGAQQLNGVVFATSE
jgi:hypothetical protein